MATDFNHIIWVRKLGNGREEDKLFDPLHYARPFHAFCVHLQVCRIIEQLARAPAVRPEPSSRSVTAQRIHFALYQVRASVTWQIRPVGSISSEMKWVWGLWFFIFFCAISLLILLGLCWCYHMFWLTSHLTSLLPVELSGRLGHSIIEWHAAQMGEKKSDIDSQAERREFTCKEWHPLRMCMHETAYTWGFGWVR